MAPSTQNPTNPTSGSRKANNSTKTPRKAPKPPNISSASTKKSTKASRASLPTPPSTAAGDIPTQPSTTSTDGPSARAGTRVRKAPTRFNDEEYLDPYAEDFSERTSSSDEDHTGEQNPEGLSVLARSEEQHHQVTAAVVPQHKNAEAFVSKDGFKKPGRPRKPRNTSNPATSSKAEPFRDDYPQASKQRESREAIPTRPPDWSLPHLDHSLSNRRRPLEVEIAQLYDSPAAAFGIPPTTQFSNVARPKAGSVQRPRSPNELGGPQIVRRNQPNLLDVLVRQLPPEQQLKSIPPQFWNEESYNILDPGFQNYLDPLPKQPSCYPIAPNNPHSSRRKEWPSDPAFIERNKSRPERSLQPYETARPSKPTSKATTHPERSLQPENSARLSRPTSKATPYRDGGGVPLIASSKGLSRHSTASPDSSSSKLHADKGDDTGLVRKRPDPKSSIGEVSSAPRL